MRMARLRRGIGNFRWMISNFSFGAVLCAARRMNISSFTGAHADANSSYTDEMHNLDTWRSMLPITGTALRPHRRIRASHHRVHPSRAEVFRGGGPAEFSECR